jgi:hypothetical protein
MEARFDFTAAWGEDSGPPPELPSHVWETITAGGNVAGLVEPDDAYGSLTAVMALGPSDLPVFAQGAVGFRRPRGDIISLTFVPHRSAGRSPIEIEFDLSEPDDRTVMIELTGQEHMLALWIDAAELIVVRRAHLSLDGARRIVAEALAS